MTYYPEFVEEFPKPLQSWEKIEIKELDSEEEAFGANVLMLDPDTMILAKQYEMLIPEYDKRGIEVIEMPFNAAIHCGFGVRCAVGPLHRDLASNQTVPLSLGKTSEHKPAYFGIYLCKLSQGN